MRKFFTSFYKDEHGATMVEYGLMVAVIAMIVVVGGIALGVSLNDTMQDTTRCSDTPTAANCILD